MNEDPVVANLIEFLESFEGNGKGLGKEKGLEKARSIGERTLSAAKDLVQSLKAQIDEITTAIEDSPNTKKLDEKINVTDEKIGTYLTFTKGEATLKANAITTDNQVIAPDMSNLKEASGDASIKIDINPTNELYSESSAIKDLKLKTNAAGNAKITEKNNEIDEYKIKNKFCQ